MAGACEMPAWMWVAILSMILAIAIYDHFRDED